MWMITTTGFYSVVDAGRGNVQIRARDRNDLERLRLRCRQQLAEAVIVDTPHADYPYRMIVQLATWTVVAARLAADAGDYTNFKNAVALADPRRATIYSLVWRALRGITKRGVEVEAGF